jgi:hypothetical protein
MFTRMSVVTALLLVVTGMPVAGQEAGTSGKTPADLRAEADALAARAAESRAAGRDEEARDLAREAELLMREAARAERDGTASLEPAPPPADRPRPVTLPEQPAAPLAARESLPEHIERRIAELNRELLELRTQGKHAEAEEVQHDIDMLSELGSRRPAPLETDVSQRQIEELQRRIHHLRIVADNLRAAGLVDRAAEYDREVEQLERELDRLIRPEPQSPEQRVLRLEEMVFELRDEIRKLRDEVRDLRNRVRELTTTH